MGECSKEQSFALLDALLRTGRQFPGHVGSIHVIQHRFLLTSMAIQGK